MTLFLHRAERTDLLADGLADLLADAPLADPFARELVVVPARGVERWLTQRLSHRLGVGAGGGDGVCAGVDFASPHSLVAMLLGTDDAPAGDPWAPDRLVWPLLEVIDASAGEAWCAVLTDHLGITSAVDDLRRNRRYAVARRLAGLFASYAVQRPQLVADWREGRSADGVGGVLADDLQWQPELWRRLVAQVGGPSPDQRHAAAVASLHAGGDGLDLPARLSLFGHTRIARSEVELLHALGEHRDVHLWLPQASAAVWDQLAPEVAAGPVPRDEDRTGLLVEHPLLASLGRDARELQRTLAPFVDPAILRHGCVPHPPDSDPTVPERPQQTVLGWLQHDLRSDSVPDPATRATRERVPEDRSVQVHACHGPARQVDVLREVLVGLLADDPTLEPRDILVMCPDVEAYAPLIGAAFGLPEVGGDAAHPGHQLRVRLADRSLAATNPLLRIAATLVDLAGSRLTATQVLDLAGEEPVRARFGFDDDALDRMRGWIAESGVRWGLDGPHRQRFGLDLGANTWHSGLDRVLLGVALSGDDHRYVGAVLPLDDVGSGDIDLAGALTEMLDRLHTFLDAADRATTVADWMAALGSAVAALTRADEPWQVTQFDRELSRITAGADGTSDTQLRLADVRALLESRLGGRPSRSNFRTGTLTVCTMVPMRSVPHRVVALLGMDDGVFPRSTIADGDDVLARRPVTGERDARAEDRQLLLDAVLAARETLVVTYTGAGEHTGSPRPPAVPLGELLDALTLTVDAAADLHVHHPLQPFDARNLTPGGLVPGQPFSFDRAALAGAEASRGHRDQPGPLVTKPLPGASVTEVSLADLKTFFAHPVRGFLRDRLGLAAPLEADPLADAVPIDLDGLQKWGVGDRLVRDVLAGMSPANGMTAELLRGLLPPGQLGQRELRDVVRRVQPLVANAQQLRSARQRTIDIDVELNGVRLTGTVSDVFGNDIVTVTYSSLGPKQRYAAWLDLLALTVGHPDEMWRSHALGRKGSGAQRALGGPLDERAEGWLADVLDLYLTGQRTPLALPPKTALAYAEEFGRLERGADAHPDTRAEKEWKTDPFHPFGMSGEDADPWHVRAWGADAPLDALLQAGLAEQSWRMWGPLVNGAELVRAL
ncbi:exodeoxyribonuclease V subunit gamma [Nocardioides cavernaquae]|uniref:RecBCD enzyme subunit RecC n=1 Tax=Nocardioides cavernaquae TaxID=2321396 RepID=A0A3A5H994_9ACTN|nr:exodeoxyribonuclease V subunit gamma [Nocardioides cavernaquae]RJS45945.1 exodeoxyribonuclease V subunit gamma [Nocardioides cavernaquae]